MIRNIVNEIFEREASDWIAHSHDGRDDVYPTAHHRARIVRNVLRQFGRPLEIADLGCGGGNVAMQLAGDDHRVTGVDQSQKMIAFAEKALAAAAPEIRERVRFANRPLEDHGLAHGTYDAVSSMGVIGYLEHDETLFQIAADLLHEEGVFLVSCRNRLFNMVSLTHRTLEEIRSGDAEALIREIYEYYETVPADRAAAFAERLEGGISGWKASSGEGRTSASGPVSKPALAPPAPDEYEPRQHTPRQIEAVASRCGFTHVQNIGVNPHLVDPNLKRLLPPGLFNAISSSLEALESLPASLALSSVFISVFRKNAS
ncbi:MAG: class I SAM-dependent methyltransferase [Rhodospirillales bacterium]